MSLLKFLWCTAFYGISIRQRIDIHRQLSAAVDVFDLSTAKKAVTIQGIIDIVKRRPAWA